MLCKLMHSRLEPTSLFYCEVPVKLKDTAMLVITPLLIFSFNILGFSGLYSLECLFMGVFQAAYDNDRHCCENNKGPSDSKCIVLLYCIDGVVIALQCTGTFLRTIVLPRI